MAKSITMGLRVKIVPCEGFDIRRAGGGEYLVVKADDTTRNVLIDADILARLFIDLANDGVDPEHFNHGFGRYWRIEEIVETDPGPDLRYAA